MVVRYLVLSLWFLDVVLWLLMQSSNVAALPRHQLGNSVLESTKYEVPVDTLHTNLFLKNVLKFASKYARKHTPLRIKEGDGEVEGHLLMQLVSVHAEPLHKDLTGYRSIYLGTNYHISLQTRLCPFSPAAARGAPMMPKGTGLQETLECPSPQTTVVEQAEEQETKEGGKVGREVPGAIAVLQHQLVVFQDVDHVLGITQHTWQPIATTTTATASSPTTNTRGLNRQAANNSTAATTSEEGAKASGHQLHFEVDELPHTRQYGVATPLLATTMSTTTAATNSSTTRTDLKVVCFNIWNTNGNWRQRMRMLEEQLLEYDPDIVALQEVRYSFAQYSRQHRDSSSKDGLKESRKGRNPRFQMEYLSWLPSFASGKYQFVWRPAMSEVSGRPHTVTSSADFHSEEGLAIFSKLPILQVNNTALSRNLRDNEDAHQRICLRTLIQLPPSGAGGDYGTAPSSLVQIFVTHMSLSAAARLRNAHEIIHWIRSFAPSSSPPSSTPSSSSLRPVTLLMGDFNAEPDSPVMAFLLQEYASESDGKVSSHSSPLQFVDAWVEAHRDHHVVGNTFPTWKPTKRIDFILLDKQPAPLEQPQEAMGSGLVAAVEEAGLLGNSTTNSGETTASGTTRERQKNVSSDHLGLFATISLSLSPNNKKDRGEP
ncbi:Endo/exonuclease/phosphatase domain-containing protein [Balamuthia mandrillaris]